MAVAKPKVSVVVPIYNVEKYLRQCVDSILGQTLKDIEVILVNDGSPDDSGKIIDEYAKRDKRVVAVHQKNGGYGVAVNKGVSLAKGDYVGIIESDDWIMPTMYESLYNSAVRYDTDVTKGGFNWYNSFLPKEDQIRPYAPVHQDLSMAPEGSFSILEYPPLIAFHASIWSSIYKNSFIKKIKIIETRGASYQDFPFMVEVMCTAKRISVVKDNFVNYRLEPEQDSSTNHRGRKLMVMADQCMVGLDILRKHNLYDSLKEELYAQALWANIAFFNNIDKNYRREYFYKLRELFRPLIDDVEFEYKYFSPSDKDLIDGILYKKYEVFRLREIIRHYKYSLREKVKRLLLRLNPSYRRQEYIIRQNDTIISQNEKLLSRLEELTKEINQS